MTQSDKPLSLSQQVSSTLQALTGRPEVESTLILSRKDGSIIKVAGSLEEAPEHAGSGTASSSAVTSAHGQAEPVEAKVTEDGEAADGATMSDAEAGPTRAEILASDIHQFVAAASSLASSLQSTARSTESDPSYKSGSDHRHVQQDAAAPRAEQQAASSEVQLLRMRTKKHEIIIYPDPNFLCCVVQNMQRQSR